MGSKTPITHALSWFILSVIDFRIGYRRIADWPPYRRGQSGVSLQSTTATLA
jgi:hypothetical protein